MAERGEGGGSEEGEGELAEVGDGPAGGPVGLEARRRVLPGVEAEAVQRADAGEEDGGGKQGGADPVGCSAEEVKRARRARFGQGWG